MYIYIKKDGVEHARFSFLRRVLGERDAALYICFKFMFIYITALTSSLGRDRYDFNLVTWVTTGSESPS